MAEALLEDAVDRSDILKGKVKVDSAGTFAPEGLEAAEEAVEVMEEMGLNIDRHKSKQFDEELADWADVILTMESNHIDELLAMAPEAEEKIHTLIGYVTGVHGFPGEEGFDIKDPFKEPKEEYMECAAQLKEIIEKLVEKLEKEMGEDNSPFAQ